MAPLAGLRRTVGQVTVGGLCCLAALLAPERPVELPAAPPRQSVMAPAPATSRTVRRAGRRPMLQKRRLPTDQDILDQAHAAYIRGERQHAIDLAAGIAEKGGELALPAWRFIGLAACSVRAYRLATRAFGNLMSVDDQEALIRACKSNGLAFINREFVEP